MAYRSYRSLFLTLIAVLFLPLVASAQNTVTISGDVKSIFSGTPPADARVKICFKITDSAGQAVANPRVANIGTIIQDYVCTSPSSGHYSVTLFGNDVVNVGGLTGVTKYFVSFLVNNSYAHGADYILNTTDSPVDLNTKSDLSVAPTPTPANADTVYLRKDGGNLPIAALTVTNNTSLGGTLGVTGNVTEIAGQNQYKAFSINKLCWVDGIKYTSISSAYTDSANCNAVFVPTLGSACYTETLAADLALNRSNVPITFMGCAVITQGAFRITAPSGTNNISIFSPFQHSSNIAGSNLGVSFGGYTGAGNAVDIGDSSGFVNNFKMVGVNVGLGQAAAGATCIKLTNVNQYALDDDSCIGNAAAANQVGFKTLGTGAFFTGLGRLLNPDCAMGGASAICIQFGPISNGIVIVGGHGNLGGASSVAIDVLGGSGIKSVGYDADVANTALTVESTAQGAFNGDLRIDSGVTNIANFGAGTNGNRLEVLNARALTTVTDSGSVGTNSVYSAFDIQFNSRLWRIESAAGAAGFEIVDVSDGSVAFAKGAGGNAQINSSPGNATIINQNTGAGMELRNAGVAVVDWDAIGTFHPAVAGAVGLGTVALPEKNVIVGQSANNSTTWQPTTTAGRTLTSPDGNSSTVMPFNFTTTAAATDNVTVTGMTASGHCTLTPTNTAAAAGIASVFISAKAANQITVTHTATANWTFDGLCTSN